MSPFATRPPNPSDWQNSSCAHIRRIVPTSSPWLDFVNAQGQSGGNDPFGPSFGIGVGYDFWLSDEWSVGPFGRFHYAALSADGESASFMYPSIGAVFTLH